MWSKIKAYLRKVKSRTKLLMQHSQQKNPHSYNHSVRVYKTLFNKTVFFYSADSLLFLQYCLSAFDSASVNGPAGGI